MNRKKDESFSVKKLVKIHLKLYGGPHILRIRFPDIVPERAKLDCVL